MASSVSVLTRFDYGGPQLSRQNQKPHGKHKIALVLSWVFAFAVRYLVFAVKHWGLREVFCFCRAVFVFAVRFSVLTWGILFLLWSIWFCREVFCFCREVFGFAVRYFVFAARFLVLPWQLWATVPLNMFNLPIKTLQARILNFDLMNLPHFLSRQLSLRNVFLTRNSQNRPYHFKINLTEHLQRQPANILVCNVTRWTTDIKICGGGRSKRVSKTALP